MIHNGQGLLLWCDSPVTRSDGHKSGHFLRDNPEWAESLFLALKAFGKSLGQSFLTHQTFNQAAVDWLNGQRHDHLVV